MVDKWEYWTCFLSANAQDRKDFFSKNFPEWKNVPKFAPQAMMPDLNILGENGWELMHMEPVSVGNNMDVMTHTTSGRDHKIWSNVYFYALRGEGQSKTTAQEISGIRVS